MVKNWQDVVIMVWDMDIYLDEHYRSKSQKEITASMLSGF
jgi:hypothetical protein